MGLMVVMVVLVVLVAAMVGPAVAQEFFGRSTACSLTCPETSKFQYQDGMVHVFDYHSSAIFLNGNREPQFGVTARAHITVAAKCELILAISHVRLQDSSDEGFTADLIRNPLRFGFIDGKVVSVCPADDEPRWSLNFKRALLSTFQNSMENFDNIKVEWVKENDVSGLCSSNYTSIQQDKGVYNITRSRSSSCIHPSNPPTTSIPTSLLQMVPMLYKEQKCLQMISAGNLKEAICKENIRLPWDSNDDTPVASMTTSLKLVFQYKADFVVIPNYEATRLPLTIEWEDTSDDEAPADWLSSSLEMIQSVHENVPSPTLFYRLTQLLKLLNYNQLTDMMIKMAPEYWSTAAISIIKLGTEPSMKLLLDFMKNKGITSNQIRDVTNTLMENFEVNPTMIDIMEETIDLSYTHVQSKLRSYCVNNSSCYDNVKINNMLTKLSNKEVPDCLTKENATNSYGESHYITDNENVEIIENWSSIGYWNKSLTPRLKQCLNHNSSRVQYAVLEALRSAPCTSYDYEDLLVNARNATNGTYMNIMMYLTLIRCPTENISQYIEQKLSTDDVNQETSFIWTHLSNMESYFVSGIVNDASLRLKYSSAVRRFSRNLKKDFSIMNRTFSIDSNMIFSDYQMKPQYVSVKLFADDMKSEIFELETRETNGTYSTSCVTKIKVKGNLVYFEKRYLSDYAFSFDIFSVYMFMFSFGLQIYLMFSFSYLVAIFEDYRRSPIDYTSRDILLQYPTSIGMPFHIKLNMTKGNMAEKHTIPSFTSKQLDIQMLIDATYTNVGTKIQVNCDVLPGLNVTHSNKATNILVNLPDKKNMLFGINMNMYNIENNRLTLRYGEDENAVESICLPLFKNLTGSTLCWEYCSQSNWWPVSKFQYSLVSSREDGLMGHNLTIIEEDNNGNIEKGGICYEQIGNSARKWHYIVRNFAQFITIDVRTPYFHLEGAGTNELEDMEKSGQVMNISGLLSCNDEMAPFTLTGYNIYNEKEDSKFEVFFNSSLFESKLLSTYNFDDNATMSIKIPYRIKNKVLSEYVNMSFKSLDYPVSNKTIRWDLGASATLSEYPSAVLDGQIYIDFIETKRGTDIDITVNKTLACSNHTLTCKTSGKWYTDFADITNVVEYKCPNKSVLWSKALKMDEENNQIKSELLRDDVILYMMEGNCGMSMEKGIFSNTTFIMPLEGETYPLIRLDMDQSFNLFQQNLHFRCSKSYRNRSMELDLTAGAVLDPHTGLPLGLGESMNHRVILSLSCDKKDPSFKIDADSRISESLQDLDLTVDVQTPFERYDPDSFKLKLNKKGSHMKTSFTSKQRGQDPTVYSSEGITDYDIVSNMLDFSPMAEEEYTDVSY